MPLGFQFQWGLSAHDDVCKEFEILSRYVDIGVGSIVSKLYDKYAFCMINKIVCYFDCFSRTDYLVKRSANNEFQGKLGVGSIIDPDNIKILSRNSDDCTDFMFLRTCNVDTVAPSLSRFSNRVGKLLKMRKGLKLRHTILPKGKKMTPFLYNFINGKAFKLVDVLRLNEACVHALNSKVWFGVELDGSEPAEDSKYALVSEIQCNVRMYVKWTFSGEKNNIQI